MRALPQLAAASLLFALPACGRDPVPSPLTPRPGATAITVETVAEGLEFPWGLAFLPDGRLLVTERVGQLRAVSPEGALTTPIPGVPEVMVDGQGGLLDVGVPPDFATTGQIHLCFSEPSADGSGSGTSLAEARLTGTPGAERLEAVRVLFRQDPQFDSGLHFGCRIVYNPDGTLFLSLGDRGRKEMAQDLAVHQGKIIHLNRDGTVPAGNPLRDRPGARPEIWSYGHRNVQGAALDGAGRLWTVEHGARGGDEINRPQPGLNYGWPVITYGINYDFQPIGEGSEKPGMEPAIYWYTPSIAPSALLVYTGDAFPAWRGDLFVTALAGQHLSRLDLEGDRVVAEERYATDGLGTRLRDVIQGPDGFLYIATDGDEGRILRVRPGG